MAVHLVGISPKADRGKSGTTARRGDLICHQWTSEEESVARRAGAIKSDKRKKELVRLKKQEEKRQKRFGKSTSSGTEEPSGSQEQTGSPETTETPKE
jgi:hypothetical protein